MSGLQGEPPAATLGATRLLSPHCSPHPPLLAATHASMATAISIQQVSKLFPAPGGGTTAAVDNVSLEIAPGELFFLLGPSGCGKTTLLRMIAGFIEPTSGRILFDGRDVSRVPPNKRNTGMVFQSYALWPHMTVEANVAFGLSVRRVAAVEKQRRVREALEAVRMEAYAHRKPNQLSGGQQQRVALARALVIRPDVLLLDEPLSNLDAKLRLELRSEIRRICKEAGLTTVYVTHDQKEALSMADRVAIMDMGRVAQIGTPRELYRRPATRFIAEFLGETNFIEGTVSGGTGTGAEVAVEVQTPVGRVVAAAEQGATVPRAGERRTCSIRPEALRLVMNEAGDGVNRFAGRLVESTYLGEVAQHVVELSGGTLVKISELNPVGMGRESIRAGTPVVVAVDPGDVVLIPGS